MTIVMNQKTGQVQNQTLFQTQYMKQSLRVLESSLEDLDDLIDEELLDNIVLEREDNIWEMPFLSSGSPDVNQVIENTHTKHVTLQDHLWDQLLFYDFTEKERALLEHILGNLCEKGFLCVSEKKLQQLNRCSPEFLEYHLNLVRSLEPEGVGYSSLRESLIGQLQNRSQKTKGIHLAISILDCHYELMLKKQLSRIAKKTGSSLADVKQSLDLIGTLSFCPGLRFFSNQMTNMYPEIIVQKTQGRFEIDFPFEGRQRLRIQGMYVKILNNTKIPAHKKSSVKEYVKRANEFISALKNRKTVLKQVMEYILKYQMPFFVYGSCQIKPMTLEQVGEEVSLHTSTISRCIKGKYVSTPHGIFSLKYFFSASFQTTSGKNCSARSVQSQIVRFIREEDTSKALSDQAICDLLKEAGMHVSRRTVTKYRMQLNIPAGFLRKKK